MEHKDCWSCHYHQIGGINLIGKCLWWVEAKKQEAKDVPAKVVDFGCKLWEEKERI